MTRTNASTVLIEWEDTIPCPQRQSEITGIRIQATDLEQYYTPSSTVIYNATTYEGQQHAFNWTWLSPGDRYEIRIAAVNALGLNGPYSNSVEIQLPDYNGKYFMQSIFHLPHS